MNKLKIWPLLIIWVGAIAVLGACLAHADTSAPVVSLKSLGDGLHILDNASPLFLRDVVHGVNLGGAATTLYKKYYVSGDLIGAYADNTEQSNGIYSIGTRFWGGELLYDQVPQIKSLADSTGVTATMLQDFTIGGWATRDFQNGLWRAGWDAGFAIKF